MDKLILDRSDFMINIRPVSDLRNKYQDIEAIILKQDESVYLTKNGYGSMVIMSIEKFEKMTELIKDQNSEEVSNRILDEITSDKGDIGNKVINEENFPRVKRRLEIEDE